MKRFNVAKSDFLFHGMRIPINSVYGHFDRMRERYTITDKTGVSHARYRDVTDAKGFDYYCVDLTPRIYHSRNGRTSVHYYVYIWDAKHNRFVEKLTSWALWLEPLAEFIDATLALPRNEGLKKHQIKYSSGEYHRYYCIGNKRFSLLEDARIYKCNNGGGVITAVDVCDNVTKLRSVPTPHDKGGYGYFGKTPDHTITDYDCVGDCVASRYNKIRYGRG